MAYNTLFATFEGRTVKLVDETGFLVRRFNMRDAVVSAQVSGSGANAEVMIVMPKGRWERYRWDGVLMRRGS